jgi:hypothetical protein
MERPARVRKPSAIQRQANDFETGDDSDGDRSDSEADDSWMPGPAKKAKRAAKPVAIKAKQRKAPAAAPGAGGVDAAVAADVASIKSWVATGDDVLLAAYGRTAREAVAVANAPAEPAAVTDAAVERVRATIVSMINPLVSVYVKGSKNTPKTWKVVLPRVARGEFDALFSAHDKWGKTGKKTYSLLVDSDGGGYFYSGSCGRSMAYGGNLGITSDIRVAYSATTEELKVSGRYGFV